MFFLKVNGILAINHSGYEQKMDKSMLLRSVRLKVPFVMAILPHMKVPRCERSMIGMYAITYAVRRGVSSIPL